MTKTRLTGLQRDQTHFTKIAALRKSGVVLTWNTLSAIDAPTYTQLDKPLQGRAFVDLHSDNVTLYPWNILINQTTVALIELIFNSK